MKPADEVRALTCHCGRIACRHHTGATMNPIASMSLAHIGTQVRVVDDSITLTGTLIAIDAEREVIHDQTWVGDETIVAGAWENITVTVGPNQINLSPSAEWEPA